ncbi:MAG: D-alanyl-D-alanine carboxypeptidase [Acetobacteraceae bacterium]|nr:D-alanyl-D-alanine carboxypeptidase [Acetobacteraceae bacterium]
MGAGVGGGVAGARGRRPGVPHGGRAAPGRSRAGLRKRGRRRWAGRAAWPALLLAAVLCLYLVSQGPRPAPPALVFGRRLSASPAAAEPLVAGSPGALPSAAAAAPQARSSAAGAQAIPSSGPASPAAPAFPDLPVTADAAILVEWRSGAVLWARNPDGRRQPASLTKMLTALVALDWGRLDQTIRVSALAAQTPGSYMGIREGEVYTLEDLLYGLLLESGNDAAVAIAQGVAGSQAAFCALMNRKAWELGAGSSHFVNAHGISLPGHYSTARDMATIARALLRRPPLARMVATREHQVRELRTGRTYVVYSTNELLRRSPIVTGVKTGTTPAAGRCLAASATSGGLSLVSVVLHSEDRWSDSLCLLGYGFRNFCLRRLAAGGQPAVSVEVANGLRPRVSAVPAGDLFYPIHRDRWGPVRLAVDVWEPLEAPIDKGEPLGRLLVLEGERPVAAVELLAGEASPRLSALGLWTRTWRRAVGLERW